MFNIQSSNETPEYWLLSVDYWVFRFSSLGLIAIIHHSPIGAYQRFIALLLEQTDGKLPFWLVPYQVAILPLNEEKEVKKYCERLKKELIKNNLRVKVMTEKTLNYRIRQVYKKKIPYYLVIGKEEVEKKILKLIYTYLVDIVNEVKEEELFNLIKEKEKLK